MKITAYLFIIIPVIWSGVRFIVNEQNEVENFSETRFEVTYEFELRGEKDRYRVRSFLPVSNERQLIEYKSPATEQPGFLYKEKNSNKEVTWVGNLDGDTTLSFTFETSLKAIEYEFEGEILPEPYSISGFSEYLEPTEYIQSLDPLIQSLATDLIPDGVESEVVIAKIFYDYVYDIPGSKISDLTDAVTCQQNQACSCNGKSRLLVSLFRAKGIPARMVGGLILQNTSKRTSHAWIEAYIGGQWIPFDALNGHFASLPAHYLEIYKGDEFLIVRNTGYKFDYMYHIEEVRQNDFEKMSIIGVWDMLDSGAIPAQPMMFLLLLPLGALLVAVFKNVIGVQTFGVFLPVLIAFAFMEMGALQGLFFFSSVIVLISLTSIPLSKWGMLYTPKLVVLLGVVTIYCLFCIQVFHKTGWVDAGAALMFPVIILTIVADKFAKKVEEDSMKAALSTYVQTVAITMLCTWILSAESIRYFFFTFPEMILSLTGIALLLGKWIGLRVMEYSRFGNFNQEVSYVK